MMKEKSIKHSVFFVAFLFFLTPMLCIASENCVENIELKILWEKSLTQVIDDPRDVHIDVDNDIETITIGKYISKGLKEIFVFNKHGRLAFQNSPKSKVQYDGETTKIIDGKAQNTAVSWDDSLTNVGAYLGLLRKVNDNKSGNIKSKILIFKIQNDGRRQLVHEIGLDCIGYAPVDSEKICPNRFEISKSGCLAVWANFDAHESDLAGQSYLGVYSETGEMVWNQSCWLAEEGVDPSVCINNIRLIPGDKIWLSLLGEGQAAFTPAILDMKNGNFIWKSQLTSDSSPKHYKGEIDQNRGILFTEPNGRPDFFLKDGSIRQLPKIPAFSSKTSEIVADDFFYENENGLNIVLIKNHNSRGEKAMAFNLDNGSKLWELQSQKPGYELGGLTATNDGELFVIGRVEIQSEQKGDPWINMNAYDKENLFINRNGEIIEITKDRGKFYLSSDGKKVLFVDVVNKTMKLFNIIRSRKLEN